MDELEFQTQRGQGVARWRTWSDAAKLPAVECRGQSDHTAQVRRRLVCGGDFVEGVSPARVGENWGFIDTKGDWVIEPKYWRVQPFSEGLAAVTGQLKGSDFPTAYIDRTGKSIIGFPKGVAEAGLFSPKFQP